MPRTVLWFWLLISAQARLPQVMFLKTLIDLMSSENFSWPSLNPREHGGKPHHKTTEVKLYELIAVYIHILYIYIYTSFPVMTQTTFLWF